jgi:hypothetical protein
MLIGVVGGMHVATQHALSLATKPPPASLAMLRETIRMLVVEFEGGGQGLFLGRTQVALRDALRVVPVAELQTVLTQFGATLLAAIVRLQNANLALVDASMKLTAELSRLQRTHQEQLQ